MPRRYIKFVKGCYYHIYNRGKDKQKIFYEHESWLYFIRLLKKNARRFEITVIAYCLMPNHFHLLLRIDGEGDLSKCISNTLNSYVQAINKKYNRVGPFFAERFQSIHVDKDNYLIHLCRYIHLNPVKARLIDTLKLWPFSNYHEFVGERKGTLFDSDFFDAYFSSAGEYREFVHDVSIQLPGDFNNYTFD